MSDRDVDAEFADIIAHWDDALPEVGAPEVGAPEVGAPDSPTRTGDSREPSSGQGPVGSQAPPDAQGAPDPAGQARTDDGERRARPTGVNPPPTRPFVVWRGADQGAAEGAADGSGPGEVGAGHDRGGIMDEDEHFEPGPTAPLPPQEDLQFWGIIVGLVLGPILLLWQVLQSTVSFWWTVGALGLTVGGFVLLVMRQPHARDEDDPDDGARV